MRSVRSRLAGFGVAASLALPVFPCPARAAPLPPLPTADRWVVAGIRSDLDEAIALARHRSARHGIVVAAPRGGFAVVEGHQPVPPGGEEAALDALADEGAPAGTSLSDGTGFGDIAWTPPPSPFGASADFDGDRPVTLPLGDATVAVDRAPPDPSGLSLPRITLARGGTVAVVATIGDRPSSLPALSARSVRLDPARPEPQAVLVAAPRGAVPAASTAIATAAPDGRWTVIDLGSVRGGYSFGDVARDGAIEIVGADPAFVGAFAAPEQSVAPLRIRRLAGGALVDVTREPVFRHRLIQHVDEIALAVAGAPGALHRNGILAGWVASKILAGQGAEAWATMLASYDRVATRGLEVCRDASPIRNCPAALRAVTPFPVALRALLAAQGYVDDPSAFPIPAGDAELRPAPPRAPVQPGTDAPWAEEARIQCGAVDEAAQRGLFGSLVKRRAFPGEPLDAVKIVSVAADIRDVDPLLRRVLCPVGATVDVERLAVQVAGTGDAARAALLRAAVPTRGGPAAKTFFVALRQDRDGSAAVALPADALGPAPLGAAALAAVPVAPEPSRPGAEVDPAACRAPDGPDAAALCADPALAALDALRAGDLARMRGTDPREAERQRLILMDRRGRCGSDAVCILDLLAYAYQAVERPAWLGLARARLVAATASADLAAGSRAMVGRTATFAWSSSGPVATVTTLDGVDTDAATATAAVTPADALSFCRRDFGNSPDGEAAVVSCLSDDVVKRPGRKLSASARCGSRTVDRDGEPVVAVGFDGGPLWRDPSGHVEGASEATAGLSAQFALLCPGALARLRAEAEATPLDPSPLVARRLVTPSAPDRSDVLGVLRLDRRGAKVGRFAFPARSPRADRILSACRDGDLCQTEGRDDNRTLTAVERARAVPPFADPKAMIDFIYGHYTGVWGHRGFDLDDARDEERVYTPRLAKLMRGADARADREQRESVTIRPFFSAPEIDIRRVNVAIASHTADRATAVATMRNWLSLSCDVVTIQVSLVRTDRGWRVDDITYLDDDGPGPKTFSGMLRDEVTGR